MIRIDPATARRYLLGRQGLWPGRRWRGARGTEAAMRAMEHVQLDPLQVLARSHDLALHARVDGYRPGAWERAAYGRRRFFDWGGWLALRPMEELRYWRVLMRRERAHHPGLRATEREQGAAIREMRARLRAGERLGNRDFAMGERTRTDHYRGRKDSALALYWLWRVGEAMVDRRERFERIYAATEAVAPPDAFVDVDDAACDDFMRMKHVRFLGLADLRPTAPWLAGPQDGTVLRRWLDDKLASGALAQVTIEGSSRRFVVDGADAALIGELAAGRVPRAWRPVGPDTTEEATFLAPLDPTCARGRAKPFFGFDYVWEVYKPLHLRRWGYYVLPVVWGDRLVARFDAKVDRESATLVLLGFWPESREIGTDPAFGLAFAAGLARLADGLGCTRIDATAVRPVILRKQVVAADRARHIA